MQAVMAVLLRAYKLVLSPLTGATCAYVPSCSEYAAEAVARHGVLRGTALAAWRVVRCNPLARGGFDPVPLGRSEPSQTCKAHSPTT